MTRLAQPRSNGCDSTSWRKTLITIRGLLPEHCGAYLDLAPLPLLAVARSGGFSGPRAFDRDFAILR
jgi:hypothetical protein